MAELDPRAPGDARAPAGGSTVSGSQVCRLGTWVEGARCNRCVEREEHIRLDGVPEPRIEQPTDAIVRITASAICGTDLHMVRGTMPGMKPGTILGHEGVGIVEEVGRSVRNLKPGDRVVIPSTIACGSCSYCRAGYQAQCDHANPNGPQAGTSFYGGPEQTGSFNGLQAEYGCGDIREDPKWRR